MSAWLDSMDSFTNSSIGSVAKTIGLLFDRLEQDGFDAVNEDLAKVDIEFGHPLHLLGVLRSLFNQRNSLSNYQPLLVKVRARFVELGLNPDRTLKGLDRP